MPIKPWPTRAMAGVLRVFLAMFNAVSSTSLICVLYAAGTSCRSARVSSGESEISTESDEPTVFLKGWERHDPLPDLGVGHLEPHTLSLGQLQVFVHELLQDLTVDAQLAKQVLGDLPARLHPIGLQLLPVDLPESRDGDLVFANSREDGVRETHHGALVDEPRNVQEHKS